MITSLITKLSLPSVKKIVSMACTNTGLEVVTNSGTQRIDCNCFTAGYYKSEYDYLCCAERSKYRSVLDQVVSLTVASNINRIGSNTDSQSIKHLELGNWEMLAVHDPDHQIEKAFSLAWHHGSLIKSHKKYINFINLCTKLPKIEKIGIIL